MNRGLDGQVRAAEVERLGPVVVPRGLEAREGTLEGLRTNSGHDPGRRQDRDGAPGAAVFIAFFAVLITGAWPEGMRSLVIKVMRLNLRVNAYASLLELHAQPPSPASSMGAPPSLPLSPLPALVSVSESLAEQKRQAEEDAARTFFRVKELAYGRSPDEAVCELPSDRQRAPRMTESWFC